MRFNCFGFFVLNNECVSLKFRRIDGGYLRTCVEMKVSGSRTKTVHLTTSQTEI